MWGQVERNEGGTVSSTRGGAGGISGRFPTQLPSSGNSDGPRAGGGGVGEYKGDDVVGERGASMGKSRPKANFTPKTKAKLKGMIKPKLQGVETRDDIEVNREESTDRRHALSGSVGVRGVEDGLPSSPTSSKPRPVDQVGHGLVGVPN